MKNVFSIVGILLLLKSIEGMIPFYSLIFTEATELDISTIIKGVLGTAIILYFLFIIAKMILKWIYFVPDPE